MGARTVSTSRRLADLYELWTPIGERVRNGRTLWDSPKLSLLWANTTYLYRYRGTVNVIESFSYSIC